ncbi:MAG: haloacid dehalogenase type II [Pseudomonadota bacterium]
MTASNHGTPLRAVLFDTFGTVVDWRTGMIQAITAWGAAQHLTADWPALVDEWRTCEDPGKRAVREGQTPWRNLEQIHRDAMPPLLARHGLQQLSAAQQDWLLDAWSLGQPWPDTLAGLERIKRRWPIASLSNGSMSQMVRLARHARLPWSCIFSAELFKAYKPAPEVYLGACSYLGYAPQEVLLCAAHNYDLRAAAALGMATAFIPRTTEFGPSQVKDFGPEGEWTFVAADLVDLADQLDGTVVRTGDTQRSGVAA